MIPAAPKYKALELLGFPTDFPRPSLLRQSFSATDSVFVRSEHYAREGRITEEPVKMQLKKRTLVIDEDIELQGISVKRAEKVKMLSSESKKVQFTPSPPIEYCTFSAAEYDRRTDGKQVQNLLFKDFL